MSKELGLIGLGTMGGNLARNAARNGAKVAVYNRTTETMHAFMKDHENEGEFVACETYQQLIEALEPPRAILIMVKAGPAVDAVIDELLPLLTKGDIIIDGGNSHYPDTDRRCATLQEKGMEFVGLGVSGGEEGALNGPSMMPGGSKKAYEHLMPLLQSMAADDGEGGKCVTYNGQGGAGHFVKMVHNGIEYGIMQLLAETYDILKNIGGLTNDQLAETFAQWNASEELRSFLLEITADIFRAEESGVHLIDVIADAAGQKGTGKWTTEAAMTYGVAIPTINAAVDARILSGSLDERGKMKSELMSVDEHDPLPPKEKLVSIVRAALELSTISAYNQGFRLIEKASAEEGWNIPIGEIARTWRGGCIIRAKILQQFQTAYGVDGNAAEAASQNIMKRFSADNQLDWRRAVILATSRGIGVPAVSASLAYLDNLSRDRLPQSLIQAQRDYFGAHTYQRTDKEGTFHSEWKELIS